MPKQLRDAWAEAESLIDPQPPQIEPAITEDGVILRVKDPAQYVDAARMIKEGLSARADLKIESASDHALHVTYAAGATAASAPDPDVLLKTVKSCLSALKLGDAQVSPLEGPRVRVQFSRVEEAALFERSLSSGCGFAIRLVDGESTGDLNETPPAPGDQRVPQVEGPALWLKPTEIITADMMQEARISEDALHHPAIWFKLNADGQRRFSEYTGANVGRRFAIVFNGVVLSAPYINMPILGGEGMITSNFTADRANDLVHSILASSGPHYPIRILAEVP